MFIYTKDLTKTYILSDTVKVEALKGVSISIEEREFVAIMGASGSGKSTLLNLIGCLDTPTSGSYLLDKLNIDMDANLARIRREKIGFIFQSFNLIPQLTALQNVEVPMIYAGLNPNDRRDIALQLLTDVGLADRSQHHPNELSGGQKQRVAIARALANNPQLIIADEPTGNLDSVTADAIINLLAKLNEDGKTIVMVTHEEDIGQHAHRIIRLHDGEVVNTN